MRPVRFLFDQHVSLALLAALGQLRPTPDLIRVGQAGAPPFGTQDPDLLIWCEETGRLLVSADLSSMAVHFAEHLMAGRHCWGVMLAPQRMSFSVLLAELRFVAGASSAEDWYDRIVHLPL